MLPYSVFSDRLFDLLEHLCSPDRSDCHTSFISVLLSRIDNTVICTLRYSYTLGLNAEYN